MGSIYVLTGGTRGIGAAIAASLVAQGHTVALVARRVDVAQAQAAQLSATGPGQASVVPGELGSLAGAAAAVAAIAGLSEPIAALIHCAGIWPTRRELSPEGLERAFVVNHLAPLALNRGLSARLAGDGARVVQVSAGLYVLGRISLEQTPRGGDFSALRTYATTKQCNVLASRVQAARWQAAGGPTLTLVHPGVVRTDLGVMSGPLGWLLRQVKRTWMTPEQGAQGPVWLATDPALTGVTDQWFDQRSAQPWHAAGADLALGEALWTQAEALLG